MLDKKYLVTVVYHIKKDVGVFTGKNDDEAIENAEKAVNELKTCIEDILDVGDEVDVYNYYTELV